MARPVIGEEPGIKLEIPAWSKIPGRVPARTAAVLHMPNWNDSRDLAIRFTRAEVHPVLPAAPAGCTITPNSLHFERHHAGIPAIDPAGHKLVIHGLVRQPLMFDYEDLLKYQMVSKILFSGMLRQQWRPALRRRTLMAQHKAFMAWSPARNGLGFPVCLLEEAGVLPEAQWIAAVGADAASMGRSIPVDEALDDSLLALFQNGEPVRPEQGYPMRLFNPGGKAIPVSNG